jgi:DNA-binding MarR family transcriptional regulator
MLQKDIDDIRAFNRFYTKILGLLDAHILQSDYSLPEARILFELHAHRQLTASDMTGLLQIDKGYLSRILKQFVKKKIVHLQPSGEDGRSTYISLTSHGAAVFREINKASNNQVRTMLSKLSKEDIKNLSAHTKGIQTILEKTNG